MSANPEYMVARSTVATEREVKEAALFTTAAVWSELPVEFIGIIPLVHAREFSRYEYFVDGDTLARLTGGRK